MSDFQQTVNLKPKPEKKQKPKLKKRVVSSRAQAIDRVYNDDEEKITENNKMHSIDRPVSRNTSESAYKQIIFVMAVILIAVIGYFVFWPEPKAAIEETPVTGSSGWYLVKLMNGESYYGQVEDIGADPVVIKNVYYNYDQLNSEIPAEAPETGGNLKLVKRGKETHGPEGVMNVVRGQVVFMEELKSESKVLKAILEYEK